MKKRPKGGFNVFDSLKGQRGGRGEPPRGRGGPPLPPGPGDSRRGEKNGPPKKVRLLIPSDTEKAIGGREFDARQWCREIENRTGGPLNRSLLYQRFAPFLDGSDQQLPGEGTTGQRMPATDGLEDGGYKILKREGVGAVMSAIAGLRADEGLAAALQKRMQAALDALAARGAQTIRIEAEQTSRLVSRLGEHHPYETGFMFHPLYGLPFLPGSGIKGAVRAAVTRRLAEEARLDVPDDLSSETLSQKLPAASCALLTDLFGTATKSEDSERAGRVVALDAFPSSFELEIDILTPHFPEYYGKNEAPTDDQKPIPIPFLSVKAKAKDRPARWSFRLALLRPREGTGVASAFDQLVAGIRSALEDWGLGAKKSSGYGAFRIVEVAH